jgi:hypothetical protein
LSTNDEYVYVDPIEAVLAPVTALSENLVKDSAVRSFLDKRIKPACSALNRRNGRASYFKVSLPW